MRENKQAKMVEADNQQDPINIVPNFSPLDRTTWDQVKDKLPNSTFQKNRQRIY